LGGELQKTLGPIGGQILGRVEERNVMSENFVGFVALDRLAPAFQLSTRPAVSSMKMAYSLTLLTISR
jgi:hypothetical protein